MDRKDDDTLADYFKIRTITAFITDDPMWIEAIELDIVASYLDEIKSTYESNGRIHTHVHVPLKKIISLSNNTVTAR